MAHRSSRTSPYLPSSFHVAQLMITTHLCHTAVSHLLPTDYVALCPLLYMIYLVKMQLTCYLLQQGPPDSPRLGASPALTFISSTAKSIYSEIKSEMHWSGFTQAQTHPCPTSFLCILLSINKCPQPRELASSPFTSYNPHDDTRGCPTSRHSIYTELSPLHHQLMSWSGLSLSQLRVLPSCLSGQGGTCSPKHL